MKEVVKINSDTNELIQYYIINQDLNMSPGKIAVQVAHVATNIAIDIITNNSFEEENKFWNWHMNGQKKIVLKVHQKKLEELAKNFYSIKDLGFTEVPEGSLTCVGLRIMTREEAQLYIKRLQLL